MSCTLDIEQIRRILPHSYPMLLIDRVLECEPGKRIVGLKNVTINEAFFAGHFPALAVMPGVMIIEAMAQAAGLIVLTLPGENRKLAYIAEIERMRFRKRVVPGDSLITEATMVWFRGEIGKARVVGRVDGEVVAEGDLKFALKGVTADAPTAAPPARKHGEWPDALAGDDPAGIRDPHDGRDTADDLTLQGRTRAT